MGTHFGKNIFASILIGVSFQIDGTTHTSWRQQAPVYMCYLRSKQAFRSEKRKEIRVLEQHIRPWLYFYAEN